MNASNKGITLLVVLFCLSVLHTLSSGLTTHGKLPSSRGDMRIMFYNTENLFDTQNDSLTNDEEFLPGSEKAWTNARYQAKLMNIFKTVAAVGESEAPEIICFAEIENKGVLNDLIRRTPLEKHPYQVIHYESPDRRGIDVGIIYRKDIVTAIESMPIGIRFPFDSAARTRDILYVKFLTQRSDTLHVFINHWPSRRGGEKQSEAYRTYVAGVLRTKVDSLFGINPAARIIITGDFNDEPADKSLSFALNTKTPGNTILTDVLYNLSQPLMDRCNCGTYRYKSEWNMIDQFIVSGSLLSAGKTLHTCIGCLHIGDFEFLQSEEKKYGGTKPFRTYQGPKYIGGFSDHLPIYLDLFY
jgi:predicted extracellular nuclease